MGDVKRAPRAPDGLSDGERPPVEAGTFTIGNAASGLAPPFRIVQIPYRAVDDPAVLRRRDRADGLRYRSQGRQGARRARLVAAAARAPLGAVAGLDPQGREERHDADDHVA